MEMEPWLQTLLTILGRYLLLLDFGHISKSEANEKLLRISTTILKRKCSLVWLMIALSISVWPTSRGGYITQDEYENLYEYLYKPYEKLGGNGSAKRIMTEVDQLAIHKNQLTLIKEKMECRFNRR